MGGFRLAWSHKALTESAVVNGLNFYRQTVILHRLLVILRPLFGHTWGVQVNLDRRKKPMSLLQFGEFQDRTTRAMTMSFPRPPRNASVDDLGKTTVRKSVPCL